MSDESGRSTVQCFEGMPFQVQQTTKQYRKAVYWILRKKNA